jgi:hypothetical protein
MLFIINVSVTRGQHKLVIFDVPPEIVANKSYNEQCQEAGWWYMNRIDLQSCTGDYSYSVFPASLLATIVAKEPSIATIF